MHFWSIHDAIVLLANILYYVDWSTLLSFNLSLSKYSTTCKKKLKIAKIILSSEEFCKSFPVPLELINSKKVITKVPEHYPWFLFTDSFISILGPFSEYSFKICSNWLFYPEPNIIFTNVKTFQDSWWLLQEFAANFLTKGWISPPHPH